MDYEEKQPISVASGVPFYHFARVCEKIASTQGKERKKEIFKTFLSRWRESHSKLYGKSKSTDSFFLPLRFLLPHLDNERSYGMKEVFLAKYYIDVLNISKESEDGKMLLNYRTPSSAKKDTGDFASVASIALKNRCPEKGNLSMEDVNDSLKSIAQANAEKQRDTIKKVLRRLIRNSSSLEQKWMIRIMLKEMKIGLNENSILPAFHPDALELYNVCNSLSKVCLDLHDLNTKLNETEIILCTPFRPMLGQRTIIVEVEKSMNYREFIIETKIDGERMQIHKDGDEYHYFSRNSIEYTKQFGATKYQGTLTPFIADVFKSDVKTCILDGEMVAYDEKVDKFVLKGSNVDVKSENLNGLHPCFVAFDLLMLNDEKLANVELKERIKKLLDIFYITNGRLQHVERKIGRSKDDVVEALNNAIDKREEGIVIKDPLSIYRPSKRKGSGWLKLKPEYLDGLGDDLDLLIVGGLYGSGHRGGKISHFILAVSVSDSPSEKPSLFMTFGKVGSGYTDKELKAMLDKLDPHWKKFDEVNPPKSILFTDGYKEKPDVCIEPENSIVVQIKAAEITASGKYKTGCTMRFPRLERIRDDKDWYECMTYNELVELKEMADGKLTYKLVEGSETSPSKKKRVITRVERPMKVAEHLRRADLSEIREVSKLFVDKEFCIVNGPSDFPKQDLEKKVVEFGGSVVQNPTDCTVCVIADKINFRVKSIMKRGNIDVVSVSWLIECLQNESISPYQHNDILFASEKTKSIFRMKYDKYGDSYVDDVNSKKLLDVFNNIKNIDEYVTSDQITECENHYFSKRSKFSLFRGCRLFVCPSISNEVNNLNFVALEFRLHGGLVIDYLDDATTHVLAKPNEDSDRLKTVEEFISTHTLKLFIITCSWIIDCLEENRKLDEKAYQYFNI